MKTAKTIFRIACGLGFIFLVAMLATGGFSLADIGLAAPGVAMAMSAVVGTPTTPAAKTATPDLLRPTISQNITKMKPAATPLDTLVRNLPKTITAKSWKYDYYAVDMRGFTDTLDTQLNPDGDPGPYTIKPVNPSLYSKDDVIILAPENYPFGYVCNVVAKNLGDGELTIVPLGTTINTTPLDTLPGIIAAGTPIFRGGNAKSELDAQTEAYAMFPEKSYNYSQIHMCQVEESVYLSLHEKEVPYGIEDYKYAALYDYRRGIEADSLWGFRRVINDPVDGEEKYFTGGVTQFINQYMGFDPSATSAQDWTETWNGWMKALFSDNSGSDSRVMFVGKDLMERLNNIPSVQRQIDAKSTAMVHGITFNRIESNFGVLDIKLHQQFAPRGWGDFAVVLDMANVEKFVYKALETEKLMLKESGQRNANAYKIDEAFGLALRYPKTHGLILPQSLIPGAG